MIDEVIAAVKELDITEEARTELLTELRAVDDECSTLQSRVDELQSQLDDWETGFTGKEAEELRTGIEKAAEMLEACDPSYGEGEAVEHTADFLRRLLDEVDARDSLRFLETAQDKVGALYHAQWSGWVHYLFEKGTDNDDGSVTLPREFVTQWSRQAQLLWPEMTQKEQHVAREAASKFMAVMRDV